MAWNWQLPDWPDFRWNASLLAQAEASFLHTAGIITGIRLNLEPDITQELLIDTLSEEALASFAIEGETLERHSVQSSLRKAFGLQSSATAPAREAAVARIMLEIHDSFSDRLQHETLFRWHARFMEGRSDLTSLGAYRQFAEPMQIVSGYSLQPKVHFEAPPSNEVSSEMQRFIAWFNESMPGSSTEISAIARAGIAHLYFESIHPFEDGNGRIGRAISDLSLAQSVRNPMMSLLSATILQKRKYYYNALEKANTGNEVTDWLRWFAGIVLTSQQQVLAQIDFVAKKTIFLDRFKLQLNERQMRALLRMLREGPGGFSGGLSAANYMSVTSASSATTTRDLAALVESGALLQTGALRHRRYALALQLKPPADVTVDESGRLLFNGGLSERFDSSRE